MVSRTFEHSVSIDADATTVQDAGTQREERRRWFPIDERVTLAVANATVTA